MNKYTLDSRMAVSRELLEKLTSMKAPRDTHEDVVWRAIAALEAQERAPVPAQT